MIGAEQMTMPLPDDGDFHVALLFDVRAWERLPSDPEALGTLIDLALARAAAAIRAGADPASLKIEDLIAPPDEDTEEKGSRNDR